MKKNYFVKTGKLSKVYGDLVAEISKGDSANNDKIINKLLMIKRGDKKLCLDILTKYRNCPVIKRNMDRILLDISHSGRLKFYKIKELIADDGSNDYILMYATDFERLSRKEGSDFRLSVIMRLILNNNMSTDYTKRLVNLVMNLEGRKFTNQLIAFALNTGCVEDESICTLSSLTETQALILKNLNKINPYVFAYQI